jgi:hypothetical protein
LVALQDIETAKAKERRSITRGTKIVRLFRQAYEQGAVLGHADVSLLLNMSISGLSAYVISHDRATGELIPRRGTIHDMGPSVTHKAIICYKSLVEKKPTSQVAAETFHSPEDVECYVQCFRRIQLCRDKGLSPEEIAQATGHSPLLGPGVPGSHDGVSYPRARQLTRLGGSPFPFKPGNRERLAGVRGRQ